MSQTFYEIARLHQINEPARYKADLAAVKKESSADLESMADDSNAPKILRALAQLELANRNGDRPEID